MAGVGSVLSSMLLIAAVAYIVTSCLIIEAVRRSPPLVPFDDNSTVLAHFNASCLQGDSSCPVIGGGFFFGLATAPAHVEDQLEDSWIEFARKGGNEHPNRGPVRAFHNHKIPEERLRFWSQPDEEIDLAKATGVDSFRLGVDWGRLITEEPTNGSRQVLDKAAVAQYREIMKKVRARKLRVMLTLFHHSMPKWALEYGGWTDRRTVTYFREFAEIAQEEFGDLVDYWVTFNEPNLFAALSYCAGTWPPGKVLPIFQALTCFTPLIGHLGRAMSTITQGHIEAYNVLKNGSSAPVGVAHSIAYLRPYGILDVPIVIIGNWLSMFEWADSIQNHLDFLGVNYYGQEFLSIAGLQMVAGEEYSEAGRCVYPDGLYHLLTTFYNRYKKRHPKLRMIVTENGMADERDLIRRPYVIEHLLAVYGAIQAGVPIDGYFHWTISDNWEWSDGYCPKFGLVAVDRANNLARWPRESYSLFTEIVKSRKITRAQRDQHWNILQEEAAKGGERPMCRAVGPTGRMAVESNDVPSSRKIATRDWRYGSYEQPSIIISLQRSLRALKMVYYDGLRVVEKVVSYIVPAKPLQDSIKVGEL